MHAAQARDEESGADEGDLLLGRAGGGVVLAIVSVAPGVVTALTFGLPAGVALGALGFLAGMGARHQKRGAVARGPAVAYRLSVAIQRVAVCLDAGTPLPEALLRVADTEVAPLDRLLRSLASELLTGSGTALGARYPAGTEAVLPGGVSIGGSTLGDDAAAVWATTAAVIRRGQSHGTRLASQLRSLARDLRQTRREHLEQQCQRAGALTVLPMGCCLLPAFVFVSVAPVVLALLGRLPDFG